MTTATRIQALRAKTIANGCTEGEALAAAAKVASLLGAAPQVTLPPDPRLTEREGEEILQHLTSLGYHLVNDQESRLHGRINAKFVETDDTLHHLVTHLQEATPLGRRLGSDAAAWFARLCAGRRIMLPERHPSGLDTQEQPHTNVRPLGAGTASPIRKR